MKAEPIIVEREFKTDAKTLWDAITKSEMMKEWYFDLPDFKAQKGYAFTFSGGPEDGVQYVHLCEVEEVVPYRKLRYSWKYKGYKGLSHVTFTLEPKDTITQLRLMHSGVETFPNSNPDFAKANFIEGWNQLINLSLKEYIEKL